MKIPKLLIGGQAMYETFANPFLGLNSQSTTTTSLSGSDSGLIDDKIMRELIKNGISSDVNEFTLLLGEIEEKSAKFGTAPSAKQIRSILAKANEILRNKKHFDLAINNAKSKNALGEYAVNNDGSLFCYDDKGKIKQVSIYKYNPEEDGQALTVDLLILLRETDPRLAGNASVITTIGSSIGTTEINKQIFDIIKLVGNSSTTSDAYITLGQMFGKQAANKPTESELHSLLLVAEAMQEMGANALFKNTQVMQSSNMLEAIKFISKTLPKDIIMLLQGRWAAAGNDINDSTKNIEDLIVSAVLMSNKTKVEDRYSYDASINKAAGTKAGKLEYNQNRNLKQIEILTQGSLNKTDYNIISTNNPSVNMLLHGNAIGALSDYDNDVVAKLPMSIALLNSIGPLVDKNHVTIGTLKINESVFDTVLYDGNDVLNIWAPTNENGDIDLSGLQTFNALLDYFEANPDLSIKEKNETLQLYGIKGYIDEQGNFTGTGNMSQFLVFTGITTDEVIDANDDLAAVLKGDAKDAELNLIDRIYKSLNNSKKYSGLDFKKGWFNWTTDVIKAPVFMKLKSTAQTLVGAFANHGPIAVTPTYESQVIQDLMKYNKQHLQTNPVRYQPSTNLLFLE